MKVSLAKSSEAMNKRHRVKRRWYKALCGMAAVVVFWTTYALVLPAITMTEEYHCGKEEHTHDASCYTGGAVYTSVCTAEADSAGYILIHSHSELCYDPAGALVCTLPEVGTHRHTDACYLTATHPACGLEESQAHTHTEACFRQQDVLICGMEETAGHSHTAQCYDEAGALICAEAESQAHAHTAECHAQESVQICGMEESAGHLHSEECGSVEERSLVCGQTELIPHTHADTCYSGGALTCGLPEAIEHTHTEACFAKTGSDEEKVLTCTKEEHTHELICTSDKTADLEAAEQWEATVPDKAALTGVWADDLLTVAQSQLGYTESVKNFDVPDDGLAHGYTRYGAWYGMPYGDWCAMYVSFCLNYAGIPREAVPYEAACPAWTEQLTELGLYHSAAAADYTPARGDIIFFADDGATASHVGIVYSLDETQISAIEGNCANQVRICSYVPGDTYILGWMSLAEAHDRAVELGLATAEETEAAEIRLEADYGDIHVVLTAARDALPAGLTDLRLAVTVPGEQAQQQIEKIVSAEDDYFALDIKIMSGEEEIQPLKPVKVTFEVKSDAFSESGVDVYHVNENAADGEEVMEEVTSTLDENGNVVMEAEHFSTYVVVTIKNKEYNLPIDTPKSTSAAEAMYDLSGDIGVSSEGYTDTTHTTMAVYDYNAIAWKGTTTRTFFTNYLTDVFGNDSTRKPGGTVWVERSFQGVADDGSETVSRSNGALQINLCTDVIVPYRITAKGTGGTDKYLIVGENIWRLGSPYTAGTAVLKVDNISISARHGTEVSDALDAYNALFQARGNKLVIGENVRTFPGQVFSIIGGSDANENTTNYSSHLVVEGGAWHQVIGGGTANMGKESEGFGTNIAVRGDAQIDSVYGGGADRGNVYGSTYVLLEGNGNVGHLYGGGLINNKGIKTYGNITIDVKGGYSGIVEAGPANGTNIVNNPDEFAASTILGTATINISSSQSVGAVYGDVFRDILDKNAATRRIKGMTTLNVTASNHFADMDFFDIINIVGHDTPQSTVVYVDDVIGGGIAAGAQGITALGGYIGRLDLKNGAALFIDKNAYVNINNESDRTISTANGSGEEAWLDHAFSGETSEERRELSTLMIDGDCITPSGSYLFDTEEGSAGLRVKGEVEGYSTLVCSGTRPDGTAYTPVYSTGDTYYYYVVADSSDTGGKAFKEPDGADYVVCYRYLSDGRIGWYLRERPTITVTNRFVRVGTGANPILNEKGEVTGSESTTEHYMILHVDMNGFAYEWSPNSDKNRVEMSWSIFDGTEAPTEATTRTGEFTLETMASITENSENFQNVTFTDGTYYDEGETENPTKRLQSFDYILDSSTAAEPGYYVLTANWHYKRSADGGATYEDVRLGQETDAARCLYDFAGNYTDDDGEVLFAADKDHGDDGYTDSVMTTYVYKDETPPKGADNALLRIYLPYGVSAAGFTAEKVAADSGESKAFEFLEEHTGSIVRNSDVAANYTTEDETIYDQQFGVTMQHESSSEHDLDNAVNFNLSLSGIEKFYCWVYSHEKLGYEDITKWSADGLRLHMTLNGLTRDGAAVGAADDNPSTYSNGELRIQTKLATASDMVKFTVAKQITDITDPDTTAEFDFTMSYKLSDGNTKTENFVLSHGKQQTFLVPAGTKVTVVESRHDGYYVRIKDSDSDEFEYSDTVTVTVTKTESDTDGVTVTFYNSPGTELPKTGGSAAAMYALGGLLTALAVCRYAHRKRRERRGEA